MARIGSACHASKWLIVGSIGDEASDGTVPTSVSKDLFEDWANFLEVVVPSEPPSVSGVEVAGDVPELSYFLKGVGDACLVGLCSLSAFWIAHVGSKIGERIWLNNGHGWDIWIFPKYLNDLIHIQSFIGLETLGTFAIFTKDFTVGCKGIAISVWKVVNDEHWGLTRCLSSLENWFDG